MKQKEFLKSIIENKINILIATDIDLFQLLKNYNLTDNIICIDGQDNNLEDIIYKCNGQTIVIKDAYEEGVINWNKLLLIVKNNPNCHLIQWKTITDHSDIKVSYEASNILSGLVYLRED